MTRPKVSALTPRPPAGAGARGGARPSLTYRGARRNLARAARRSFPRATVGLHDPVAPALTKAAYRTMKDARARQQLTSNAYFLEKLLMTFGRLIWGSR